MTKQNNLTPIQETMLEIAHVSVLTQHTILKESSTILQMGSHL